jgi:hypothetical protein
MGRPLPPRLVARGLDPKGNYEHYDDLEPSEIIELYTVCHGAAGASGQDGLTPLVVFSEEPPGKNCTNGGIRVETGYDNGAGNGTAGNGQLEPGEVTATSYICNGANGLDGRDGTDGRDGQADPAVPRKTAI